MKKLLLSMLLSIPLFAAEQHNIKISNCMMFLNHETVYLKAFERACKKAKVSPLLLNGELNMYGNVIYYYISEIGYISIQVNDNSADIYWHSFDDSYDYEKFLGAFMKYCYKFEAPHVPSVIFDGEDVKGTQDIDFDFDELVDSGFSDLLD